MVFPPEADRLGRGLFVCAVCLFVFCVCVCFCVFVFFLWFLLGVLEVFGCRGVQTMLFSIVP